MWNRFFGGLVLLILIGLMSHGALAEEVRDLGELSRADARAGVWWVPNGFLATHLKIDTPATRAATSADFPEGDAVNTLATRGEPSASPSSDEIRGESLVAGSAALGASVDGADVVDWLLESRSDLFALPDDLEPITREAQFGPIHHVTRRWTFEGLPVEGLSLTLHLDLEGRIRVISALGFGKPEILSEPWALSRREIEARAYQLAAEKSAGGPMDVAVDRAYEATSEGLKPVWRVGIDLEPPALPIELRLSPRGELLSAHTRAAFAAPRLEPAAEAGGTAYLDSPLDGETADVPILYQTSDDALTGDFAQVYQYAYVEYVQTAEPTSSDGGEVRYDYPPIEEYSGGYPTQATQTDSFAEVMMYYHVNNVHDFFNDIGYFNDDPSTGIDRSMLAIVNYRSAAGYYDNAYYSPPASSSQQGTIVFGQGEATDFTYDSSIIYHEYTHAVVGGSSDYLNYCVEDIYGSDCTQGGLSEGTADYFASTLRNDPVVGGYGLGEWMPGYERDLRTSSRCPDDLYGEEHEDGKIWGATLWEVRNVVANNVADEARERIDPVIFAAISTPISSDTSEGSAFSYVAAILESDVSAAVDAGTLTTGEEGDIRAVLEDRGMLDCKRFVPLEPGVSKEGAFSTTDRPFVSDAVAAGLQYVVTASSSATALNFELEGPANATIYVRKDQPVEFSSSTVTADLTVEGMEFRLATDSSLPLESGHEYYITFTATQTFSTAFYGFYYTVKASFESNLNLEDSGGGCGCTHNAPETPISAPAVLLLLGILRLGLSAFTSRRKDELSKF